MHTHNAQRGKFQLFRYIWSMLSFSLNKFTKHLQIHPNIFKCIGDFSCLHDTRDSWVQQFLATSHYSQILQESKKFYRRSNTQGFIHINSHETLWNWSQLLQKPYVQHIRPMSSKVWKYMHSRGLLHGKLSTNFRHNSQCHFKHFTVPWTVRVGPRV